MLHSPGDPVRQGSQLIIVTVMALLALCPLLAHGRQALHVVPTPRSVAPSDGIFTISSGTTIILGTGTQEELFAARQINDELAQANVQPATVIAEKAYNGPAKNFIYLGTPSSIRRSRFVNDSGARILKLMKNGIPNELPPAIHAQGYILDIRPAGVFIIADSEQGKFYGVMTAMQLLQAEGGSMVMDAATIVDYPQHRLRGISDDISRGQVSTMANFKKIIRFLARYKMNIYSPYIEDMAVVPNHPLIGKGRGALTADELRDIDAFARTYHVDVVPIVQTLGHWENILALPEYVGLAEYPGGRTVNVSDERVYALLEEMIGGICRSLSGPWFNIGADETRDVGLGANKERVAARGLPAVLAEHYTRIAAIVRRHGKIPMIYGDMILKNPVILALIPRDIVIVDWNYDPLFHYDSPKVFRNAGFTVLASPGILSYRGPFLDMFNSFSNIQQFSRAAAADSTLGVLISSWNDYGGEQLRELNYYGYAWGATCAWEPYRADAASFSKAFFRDFFGTAETDEIESAYALLSSPSNHFSWFELWRHPMLPFMPRTPLKGHSPIIMERLQSINTTMPLVLSLLDHAKSGVKRNADHLTVLAFIAKLNLWFARKVETEEKVRELSHWAGSSAHRDSVAEAVVRLSSAVVRDLETVKHEFGVLWLKTNKPEGLELLQKRCDRQSAYWREKIFQVQHGIFWVDPEIESAWIYHPDTLSSDGVQVRVQHAYFRKTLVITGAVHSAYLQLIGDTHAQLSINGKAVGEVYVRRSNSLSAEQQRIKLIDIAPFLTPSVNSITVDAQDYSTAGSAGVNICGEVQYSNGEVSAFVSDTTWTVSHAIVPQWTEPSFDDSHWKTPRVKQYQYTVVRPDFTTGRTSWIEQ